eukprot:CAMPEP_0182433780 /NCGR_PEP_ID=MMETSP1167-20130531/65549_1 /TAXON_ID=2988 /ORGANISM="Mallomonas Sp, Strain CCMP3275" /LENGTH=111 /DNA_ID=CAMNT_0024622893 /DNA_START=939 /DNA_END=1274 /DNA_ORIENTATION=-
MRGKNNVLKSVKESRCQETDSIHYHRKNVKSNMLPGKKSIKELKEWKHKSKANIDSEMKNLDHNDNDEVKENMTCNNLIDTLDVALHVQNEEENREQQILDRHIDCLIHDV